MGKTIISDDDRYEWDSDKEKQNIKRHGISFSEILEVFDDPAFIEGYDLKNSRNEERYYGIGCIQGVLFILVVFTERGKRTRIISARQADRDDREVYDEHFKKINARTNS